MVDVRQVAAVCPELAFNAGDLPLYPVSLGEQPSDCCPVRLGGIVHLPNLAEDVLIFLWSVLHNTALSGWSSPEVAEAFGVTADSVRHWRQWFVEGGIEALRSILAPGPSPERGERALEIASAVLREPVENRTNWTLPRLCAEIERQTGTCISRSRLSVLLRQKGGSTGAARGTR